MMQILRERFDLFEEDLVVEEEFTRFVNEQKVI